MTERKVQKFSTIFNFDPTYIDFIDVDLDDDLCLFVDPLLFWRSPHPEHHVVHARIINFFDESLSLIREGKISIARNRFKFPEPENLLGVSSEGHRGRGLDKVLGGKIFDKILCNPDILSNGLTFLNELQLVIPDVGPDAISDMTVNIAKDFFIDFTQKNCRRYNIPMKNVSTLVFDIDEQEWIEKIVELPINPITDQEFLLTPKLVVRKSEITLNYKDVYRDHLRDVFKVNLENELKGLGVEPKVLWKDVEKQYPKTKSIVVDYLSRDPKVRRKAVSSIERSIDKRGLELTIERLKELNHYFNGDFDQEAIRKILEENEELMPFCRVSPLVNGEIIYLITDLNKIIERSNNSMALILGSYSGEDDNHFETCRDFVEQDSMVPCIIKDMPDINVVNPRQKLFTYAVMSRYIIVLDFGPSGHLNEIELLKDLTKPVILISENYKGASYMTSGLEVSHSFYKRFTLEEFGSINECLNSGIAWAETKLSEIQAINRERLPWLEEVT